MAAHFDELSPAAHAKPPEAPPSAFPSVVVITSMRPSTPQRSCVPRPVWPMNPVGVRIVEEHHRVIRLGEAHDFIELRQVAVHGEDAVGDDHPKALVLVLLQLLFQVRHVGVFEAVLHRFRQAHAVDDGRMHQPVGDHDVLVGQAGFEESGVGIHARREQQRVFRPEKLRELVLEFAMDVLGSADEAHRRHAIAARIQPRMGGSDHLGMARQPEVVIGADIDALVGRRPGRGIRLRFRRIAANGCSVRL